MAQKSKPNANKFTFVWKKSVEKYNMNLLDKSNKLYNELFEKQIIPEMTRENDEQLSIGELSQITENLEEVID